ncbi:MAG: lipopolysaccharide biosynthesis protein [Bacteroidales bacterium]
MSDSVQIRAVKGVVWNIVDKIGAQFIQLVFGIILARLLMPEDFGLIGIVTVVYLISRTFVESGLSTAYIQKKEVNDADANTVFYTNLLISIVFYGIIFFASPLIAKFYEKPILVNLTRVMALVLLINAFNIIQIAQLTRNIDFKRNTIIHLSAIFSSGIIGITTAYYGMGVWALVIQNISNRAITSIGLWMTSKWKPAFQFSIESFKEMFSFGSWILFSSIIRVVFDNIYILVIGKVFSIGQLGFYTKAKNYQKISSQELTRAVSLVAFPIFSSIQDNKEKLRNTMKNFLQQTYLILTIMLVLIIVVAKPFVIVLLTEKWAPMIPYLQLLCISGLLFPLHQVNVQVLLAQGKSKLNFNLSLIKNLLRILNIIIMYRFGIIHIIFGEIILSFIALYINTWFTKKYINYGLYQQVKDISMIIIIGVLAGLLSCSLHLLTSNLLVLLFTISALAISSYTALMYFLNRNLLLKSINSLKLRK